MELSRVRPTKWQRYLGPRPRDTALNGTRTEILSQRVGRVVAEGAEPLAGAVACRAVMSDCAFFFHIVADDVDIYIGGAAG